ncbi:MAG: hypothetical protein RR322_01820 [Oscillospiraceae bacterium]
MKTIIFKASPTSFFCGNDGSTTTNYKSHKKKIEIAETMRENGKSQTVNIFCCPVPAWTQKVCEKELNEFWEWANTQERLL